jgi:hypothetical protein
MTRSSSVKTLGLCLFLASTYACGDNKPPPKPPESMSMGDDAGPSDSATLAGDAKDGGTSSSASTESTTTAPAAAAALALPAAAAKLKVEGKKKMDVELKSDGTVNNGGKMAAKIAGMELHGPDGKTALKVDGDGAIMTAEGGPYAKFEGDDLATQTGTKWSIGDDGAMSSTDDKGKKTALGKAEGVGAAKRASLLAIAFLSWGMKAPAAPAPKAAPEGKKKKKKDK